MKYYKDNNIYFCVYPDQTYWCFCVNTGSPTPYCTFWPKRSESNYEKDTKYAPGFIDKRTEISLEEFKRYYKIVNVMLEDMKYEK